ncbi:MULTISPECIES: FAD-binding oxidoreductase [unclassified Endozoicomonas]|uniref:FAD-binding oxidoreductase n=2 Tax=Endozoicomonas TaxID=305899 RepID=UPI002148E797|nr:MULTISPECIES: FAD-binding oxidoreductase [unclassified Endozoicomonas]
MPRPLYPATLTAKHQLSENTVQLDFRLEAGFDYQPGQFVQLHFSFQGQDYKRSYSISNSPESFRSSQQLEIAISFVKGGTASALFSEAEPGLELSIGGPFGVLTAPEKYDGRIILVGTGTGVAPYRAMIPALKKLADEGTRILVMMGVRHRADMIYEQDFRHLADSSGSIEYRACYSREKSLDTSANEYPGYLQNQFPQLNLSPEKDLVYLCGNPAMIDDASAELTALGFAPRQVKREKYVFSS